MRRLTASNAEDYKEWKNCYAEHENDGCEPGKPCSYCDTHYKAGLRIAKLLGKYPPAPVIAQPITDPTTNYAY